MVSGTDTVAIVGSGALAVQLAYRAAAHGLTTVLFDPEPDAAAHAAALVRTAIAAAAQDAAALPLRAPDLLDVRIAQAIEDLSTAPLLIDTRMADPQTTREACHTLARLTATGALLLICIDPLQRMARIAAGALHPGRIVGLHIAGSETPAPLVEVVGSPLTGIAALEASLSLMRRMGMVAVTAQDAPGLIVTRLNAVLRGEALAALVEGIEGTRVDAMLQASFGMARSPIQDMDAEGLAAVLTTAIALYEASYHEPRYRPHALLARLVDAGLTGRADGRGLLEYDDGPR